MTRTRRLPLVAAALLSLVAPLGLSTAPARATDAPQLYAYSLPGPGNPLKVERYDPDDLPQSPRECVDDRDDYFEDCSDLTVTVSTAEDIYDITATVVEHEGLYVDPLVTEVHYLESHQATLLRYAVRARTPGLHTLTIEITAPGAETQRVSLPYVWSPGGAPIAGNDSLAGRLYGANSLESYPCAPEGSCTYRESHRVSFVSRQRASTDLALDGRQRCGKGRGCSSYHYDTTTGLLQIGRRTIGRITQRAAFIDGERYARMAYPRPGQRLDGRWSYGAAVDEGRGVVEQTLQLRADGHFRLYFAVDTHRYPDNGIATSYSRTSRGTYRIGHDGRITFTSPGRTPRVATLAVITSPSGTPRAAALGVWLDLSVNPPTGSPFVDGNRLYPVSS